MYVFNAVFDDELSVLCGVVDVAQFVEQWLEFVVGNEVDAVEHGDVCHGAEHVVGCEVEVELAVVAYGEAVDFFEWLC